MRFLSFALLLIPTFIFLVIFEPAFELYLDFFDVTGYNIYANSRVSPGFFADMLFSGFRYPGTCLFWLIIALPPSLSGMLLMNKKPGINIVIFTLLLTLLLMLSYHLVYHIPSLIYYDRKHYPLKLSLLGIAGFILLLPFTYFAKRLYRKALLPGP